MPMLAPQAILFDLDGTLVDTAPDLAQATNALRMHHGLDPLPFEVIRRQVSNGGSALVTLALGLEVTAVGPSASGWMPMRRRSPYTAGFSRLSMYG